MTDNEKKRGKNVMRVAVFGGTGFVGEYLVDALIDAGHEPQLLVRPGSEAKISSAEQCRLITGSLSDSGAISRTINECSTVIYNVGILRESRRLGITFESTHYQGVVDVVDAAAKAGTDHFILMSANGIRPPETPYQDTKCRAEEYLKQSGLNYTIFQPSVIFGDPRGKMEIATQLFQDMIRVPLPAVGFHTGLRPSSGAVMMSPVHVRDVADAFVSALENPAASQRTFTLGGPDEIAWSEMLRIIARSVGKSKLVLPMPISIMYFVATMLDWMPFFPVTRDQLTMLAAGNTATDQPLRSLIGRDPTPFSPEALSYLTNQ